MITAHGGAMGTGRNTKRYFQEMLSLNGLDAIEVDIRKRGDSLILGHTTIPFFKKNRIGMNYVLDYCVKNNIKVNCDLKRKNLVSFLSEYAEDSKAKDHIYITGSVSRKDLKYLSGMSLFVNDSFYFSKFGPPRTENLKKIKDYLDSFGCDEIAGLNVSKIFATPAFLEKAASLDIKLSVYTVDDEPTLKTLLNYNVFNVTTNNIKLALELRS